MIQFILSINYKKRFSFTCCTGKHLPTKNKHQIPFSTLWAEGNNTNSFKQEFWKYVSPWHFQLISFVPNNSTKKRFPNTHVLYCTTVVSTGTISMDIFLLLCEMTLEYFSIKFTYVVWMVGRRLWPFCWKLGPTFFALAPDRSIHTFSRITTTVKSRGTLPNGKMIQYNSIPAVEDLSLNEKKVIYSFFVSFHKIS